MIGRLHVFCVARVLGFLRVLGFPGLRRSLTRAIGDLGVFGCSPGQLQDRLRDAPADQQRQRDAKSDQDQSAGDGDISRRARGSFHGFQLIVQVCLQLGFQAFELFRAGIEDLFSFLLIAALSVGLAGLYVTNLLIEQFMIAKV